VTSFGRGHLLLSAAVSANELSSYLRLPAAFRAVIEQLSSRNRVREPGFRRAKPVSAQSVYLGPESASAPGGKERPTKSSSRLSQIVRSVSVSEYYPHACLALR
jgi:hypothetical protein